VQGELQRTFGQNLRAYRKARGLTQEKLADELDCDKSYIGGIERGERNLSLGVLEGLAGSIGADPLTMLTPQPAEVLTPHAAEPDDSRSQTSE
jgi:transcriptional regulator with XRE-family HTH domain